MAIFALFDQNQIAHIFDEKQGYSMAIFALFHQNQIAHIFDEKQGYSMAIFCIVSPKSNCSNFR